MTITKSKRLPRATLEQKIMVLDHFHASQRTQANTVEHFREQIAISTSSLSEWLKEEASLREQYSLGAGQYRNSKRKLKFKYELINNDMGEFVKMRKKNGEAITEPILREHWRVLAARHGVEDPKRLQTVAHQDQERKQRGSLSLASARQESLGHSQQLTTQGLSQLQSPPQSANTGLQTGLRANATTNAQTSVPPAPGSTFLDEYNDDYMQSLQGYDTLMSQQGFLSNQFRPQPHTTIQPQLKQQQMVPNRPHQSLRTTQTTQATQTINESDFERFLLNYADVFLSLHQADYPETQKLFVQMCSVFKREKEVASDKRLKDLLYKR
ncbi:hypothetical protein BON22_3640 [Cyberlindnera fabianii]|uniref:HTH CENPB-type domain-containing protein n=1 Tax=Cyberlindnera fabianii TaxID=36022 RepID=A0A1V2L455_CYBFA|nr:hypothetical protein BON22_3640 [Cyberlindnera fabianii]